MLLAVIERYLMESFLLLREKLLIVGNCWMLNAVIKLCLMDRMSKCLSEKMEFTYPLSELMIKRYLEFILLLMGKIKVMDDSRMLHAVIKRRLMDWMSDYQKE